MIPPSRRTFLRGTAATGLLLGAPAELLAQASVNRSPAPRDWNPGRVRHLLPTVSDTRILIKASFDGPSSAPPNLLVAGRAVRGRMGDTRRERWPAHAAGLAAGRP